MEQEGNMIPGFEQTEKQLDALTVRADLISRREAIKAIRCGHLSAATIYGRSDEGMIVLAESIRAINSLPSAQPEIIRCKDCKWFIKEYGWNCIVYTVCGISPTHHPIRREEDFCSRAEQEVEK